MLQGKSSHHMSEERLSQCNRHSQMIQMMLNFNQSKLVKAGSNS